MKVGDKVRIKLGYSFAGIIATVSTIRHNTVMVHLDKIAGCGPHCLHPYTMKQVVKIKQIKLKKFSAWK